MTQSQETMQYDDYSPIYSSRIHVLYLQYIEKHYPEIDINGLLKYAGITMDQVQDLGHWFNQVQVDRFHERLVELTKRPDISRLVGQFGPEANMGLFKVFASGFLLEYVFSAVQRIIPKMTLGAEIHTNKLGNNMVEILVKPKPGVNEKRYQCDNRVGFFEGAGRLFTGEAAVVEHPKCFHDGEDNCQYIVTFKRLPHMIWKDILKISYLLLLILLFFSFFLLPLDTWGLTVMLSVVSVFGISHLSVCKERSYLNSIIEMQKHSADEQLDEWAYSPDIPFIFKTISQIGAKNISSPKRIISNILKQMRLQFPFDYGAILLLKDEMRFAYMDDYGTKKTGDKNSGVPLSEFKEFSTPVPKKPIDIFNNHPLDRVFEEGINYKMKDKKGIPFSRYFEDLGIRSLCFFPMLFGKKVLGSLLIGFYDANSEISKAYENTISYLATQMAAVLTHSMLYEELADKSQHRLLMGNLKGMIFRYHLNKDKTIDFVSDGCFELTGLEPESISSFSSYEQLIHPEDRHQYALQAAKITSNTKEYEIEYRIITNTGEEKWVWEKGKPIVRSDNSIILDGFITDTTEKKVIENLKNEFIDRTSHELRTPLHAIMLNASPFLELETYSRQLSGKAKKKIERILKTAETMDNTVDGLLNFSQLENKKIITDLNEIPLYKIIDEGVTWINSHTEEKGHELHVDIDRKIVTNADRNQMQIVINNLLINAVKYTPDNGVIMVSAVKENGIIRIEIVDNGYGVPPEYQEKIFQEFFKIKTEGRETIKGSGLGLAIARKIMVSHNGRLYCKSPIEKEAFPNLQLGGDRKGSIFVIELSS